MSIGFTEAEVLRILAGDAYKAWEADKDMRCGKLLRAMLDPDFRKGYRPALIVVPDTVRDADPDLLEVAFGVLVVASEIARKVKVSHEIAEIPMALFNDLMHLAHASDAAIAKAKGEA